MTLKGLPSPFLNTLGNSGQIPEDLTTDRMSHRGAALGSVTYSYINKMHCYSIHYKSKVFIYGNVVVLALHRHMHSKVSGLLLIDILWIKE